MLFLFFCCHAETDTGVLPQPELIELQQWQPVDPQQDPLPQHHPQEINCQLTAFTLEAGNLEIKTGDCNYISVDFTIVQDVPADTPIRSVIFHEDLWAPEPAQAHIAWVFPSGILWEQEVEIPSSSSFHIYETELPAALKKGDTVHLHLHNHGMNTWNVIALNRLDVD